MTNNILNMNILYNQYTIYNKMKLNKFSIYSIYKLLTN